MGFQQLTLAQIETQAQAYVGDPSGNSRYGARPTTNGTVTGPSLLDVWVNGKLTEMCNPGLGIQDLWTGYTEVGLRLYPMPPGSNVVKRVWVNGTEVRYVEYVDLDWFDTGNSYPDRFAIWRGYIVLGALPPDNVYTLVQQYYRVPQQLVADGDVPELPAQYHMALVYGAGSEVARADGESGLAQDLERKFERMKMEFQGWVDHQTTQFNQVRNVTETSRWCRR